MIIKPCTSHPGLLVYTGTEIDLIKVRNYLSKIENIKILKYDEFLLTIQIEDTKISIFPDGRIILLNIYDEKLAKSIVSKLLKYLGQ